METRWQSGASVPTKKASVKIFGFPLAVKVLLFRTLGPKLVVLSTADKYLCANKMVAAPRPHSAFLRKTFLSKGNVLWWVLAPRCFGERQLLSSYLPRSGDVVAETVFSRSSENQDPHQ